MFVINGNKYMFKTDGNSYDIVDSEDKKVEPSENVGGTPSETLNKIKESLKNIEFENNSQDVKDKIKDLEFLVNNFDKQNTIDVLTQILDLIEQEEESEGTDYSDLKSEISGLIDDLQKIKCDVP